MELEKWAYGTLALALAGFVGKWLVPFLMRILDNSVASATASGNALATITAERDQWKTRAIELDAQLQEMRREWAVMKGDISLLKYRLHDALVRLAKATGEPVPAPFVDQENGHGQGD